MSDDISSTLQRAACIITGMGTIVWTIITLVAMADLKLNDAEWRLKLYLKFLAIPLLAWLWFPWVGYGLYRVARWSTNGIDYCERPPTVIPAKPEVIDLNVKEKP